MQAVSHPALGERALSVQGVRAEAICSNCEAEHHLFKVFIIECGDIEARCLSCGEVWETPDRRQGQDSGGDQTVAQVGDEQGVMVPPPPGGENWFKRKMIDVEQYEAIKRAIRNWK